MILRLRHAVPWLQNFGGWSTCTAPPPLLRRFAGAPWTTSAVLAPGASDADGQPTDSGSTTISSTSAGSAPDKKKRRSTRGMKAAAAAETEVAAVAPAAADKAKSVGEADGTAASPSSQAASPTIKRRASTRRKAAAESSEGAEPQVVDGANADTANVSAAAPVPAKRTRRKKQEEPPRAVAEGGAPGIADEEARRGSGADASSSSSSAAAAPADVDGPTTKKRAGRSTKKTAAEKPVGSEVEASQAEGEERPSVRSLPYEDFLVLPRKAEHLLVALGLRTPITGAAITHHATGAGADEGPAAAAAGSGGGGGSITSVLELASYLGRPDPRELVTPLLISQYQGYLGPSPDYLYDMFYLDYDPPYLPSEVVRGAALAAVREVARASTTPLSARGTPQEALAAAAMRQLQAAVGEAAVAAQDARAPRLAESQLELFLLDWASAKLSGLRGEKGGIPYLARRCAALQLSRPIVVERLHRYTVGGEGLEQLAAGGSSGSGSSGGGVRAVRLSQPMEALLEGLKAGVRLQPERLMADFRLTAPGSPVAEHVDEIRRAVVSEAVRSLEPGSLLFYSTLVEKLHVRPEIRAAIRQQEAQWQREQGERDGSALTHAQVRLLFHLWRRERFRDEEAARRSSQLQQQQQAQGV